MRPVLVPIYDGSISKALVDSGALRPLLDAGYPVILTVDSKKLEYYQKRFGPQGYRVIPHPVVPKPAWLVMFQNIGVGAIPSRMMLLRHLRRMRERRKYVLGFFRLWVWVFGHLSPTRWVLQRLVLLHRIPRGIRELIDAEQPALIFCPTLLSLEEIDLLRYAKKKRIPVVGMVKTWDNITTKLNMPIPPDHLVVNTGRVREEACQVFGYPASRISVVGLPQYDRYTDSALRGESREDFCRRMGLDPSIPILLYCAAGLWMSPDEPEILKRLDADIEKGVFGPLQVMVRMHPKYDCGAEHLKTLRHIVLDRPGTYVSKDLTSWEYEDHDILHLISSLRHAAVTTNTASTMSLEAAYFDRPVVTVGFDPLPTSWIMSNARYYEREYYLPVVQSGGIRVASSYEQFVKAIQEYLADSSRDHEGRERIVLEQMISRDPVAAKALGDVLLACARGEQTVPSRL